MKDNQILVLVHGFNKTEADMFPLKTYLLTMNYPSVYTINLPTRFQTLAECTNILASELERIYFVNSSKTIHFIGHSMGGLIIRNYLAKNVVPSLGRCVFIATPNYGTKLADLLGKLFPPALFLFKPLKALLTNNLEILPPLNSPYPSIGIIAGNHSNLFLGRFLAHENDGRVEVESTKLDRMNDFIVVPYGHKQIHHQPDVAALVDTFLRKGSFSGPSVFNKDLRNS